MTPKPVIVEAYNDRWPVMFDELQSILRDRLGKLILTIEHVGSTSVPKLAAKPIIDIDIVTQSISLLPEVIVKLNELGYNHEGNLGIEDREAFSRIDERVPYDKSMNRKPEHHLYVCSMESAELERHVTFRNILRTYPNLLEEYASLKKELAKKFRDDRNSYTEGKTRFITRVMEEYKSNG